MCLEVVGKEKILEFDLTTAIKMFSREWGLFKEARDSETLKKDWSAEKRRGYLITKFGEVLALWEVIMRLMGTMMIPSEFKLYEEGIRAVKEV